MMTAEQRHIKMLKIIMAGFKRKLTKAERQELANLAGYYIHDKRGPIPKDKQHLPHIGETDFRTPASYKALVEKMSGGAIQVNPQWKEGYPKGKIRKNDVQVRRRSRAKSYLDADQEKKPMQILYELAEPILTGREDGRTDANALHSAITAVSRDVMSVINVEINERIMPEVISDISTGLAALRNKHTNTNRTD